MALPKQVQAQIDAVEALYQPDAPAPSSQEPAQAPAPAVEAQAPAPAVEPTAAPAPAPTPAPQDEAELWKQRYRSLQGIHNSEARRLQERAEAAERELEAARRATPPQQPAPEQSPVDPKDADVFGADLMEAVVRVVNAKLMPAVNVVSARLAAVEERLKGTQNAVVQTAEDRFWEQLEKRVPDFQQVNESQVFLDWLKDNDPVSGATRQALLNEAGGAWNVDRVVAIVNAFKREMAPAPAAAPVAAPATPASQLERQVSPRQSGGGSTVPQGPQRIRQAEVIAYYRDVQMGKYRGNPAEAERLEKMYNDALAEGRIDQ